MSIRRRLWNVARSELNDLLERTAQQVKSRIGSSGEEPDVDFSEQGNSQPDKIKQYYANLELAEGASLREVRSAYRRLMRSYHPDRHAQDPEKVKVANEVAQRLRQAYEGLRAHLEKAGQSLD